MHHQFFTPSQENWLYVEKKFAQRWNFPHCVGALDGKHVVIMAPAKSQGRHSDGGVFKNSEMGRRFSAGLMNLPSPNIIDPAHSYALPYVIVGNEAFQLNTFTMRPYPGRNISPEKRVFNYRLSRARRVVENAFGIMTARWRIYHKPMNTSLATTESIVQATVCLHNFMMTRDCYCNNNFADHMDCHGIIANGAWRENISLAGAIEDISCMVPVQLIIQDKHLRSEIDLPIIL
ncbi:uncharacterized protein LOC143906704 [Temnothorax americanus]|uniref:uncharacterized protein LOC143906704 n=1 Tax=Temnothorax americanus TaxID=1964332 RepID=UPI004067B85D